MRQKGFAPILILPIIAFVAIFAYLTYKSLNVKLPGAQSSPSPFPEESASPTISPISLDEWKTYENSEFNFKMQYPKEFSALEATGKEATPSAPLPLRKIAFTDSNKNEFTLNIYAESANPDINTRVDNLDESSGYCGSVSAARTITSQVFNENGLAYKLVAQVDENGRNIADYCFFSPKGNLFVLRNNTGSTVVGMKRILESVVFSTL